ncbi:MAG TPA: tRNA uridine-5-carboxymethylaminomethyl(34) synthesis GTPase MnmE [Devosiaceae bacterium]|jgi:tRNA modification GTPase|nr:tRNA uridine-5-carboxymethylaminomethyl(34) synthesis GTPase MnmE [Devosiaceae bacterium]
MSDGDTIVALSSGSLPSGVAVLRLSGPRTSALVERLAGFLPEPRRLTLRPLMLEGDLLDQALVAWFPAPKSFTGEDCAELHLHGSPATVRAALRALTAEPGVRPATAGEFTRRAFEAGKLDLTEVEGLGDLIAAETENQRRQALARFDGGLSSRLDAWRERLLDARAEIEAQLDFSDEGDVGELPPELAAELRRLESEFRSAMAGVAQGRITREGLRVALAGAPNAGKSSLLNALAKDEVAIVTSEPGTTRDIKEVSIDLNGQLVVLLDMAGLRSTDSIAEAEGVRRAEREIASADLVLWLVPADGDPLAQRPPAGERVWVIGSKSDLGPAVVPPDLQLSVTTGAGLEELLRRLTDFAAEQSGAGEPILVSRERDLVALRDAATAVASATGLLGEGELAAEQLRVASHALGRLLGRMDAESVLDQLFSRFCIGK